jgi:glycerol-3-phosphate dehydrogenase subunit C
MWVDYCNGCGACSRACPSGVKVAELNARARAEIVTRRGLPLRNRILGRPELLGKLGSPSALLVNLGLRRPESRALVERLLGIHHAAPLPAFSRVSFRKRFRHLSQPQSPRVRVAYFHGCSTNYYEPWVGEAAVRLLGRCGVAVELPQQHCCGLPLISNGEFVAARRYAERTLRELLPAVRSGLRIVATSTSCSYALKAEYREVLGMRTPEVAELATATYDLFEFLREQVWAGKLELLRGELRRRVLYHPPCQLRSHGVGVPAADFLASLDGIELAESGVECCGIGGTYGLKTEKYAIGQRIGRAVAEQARRHRAEVIACDSETCRWQIQHLTGIPSRHPAELLWEAVASHQAES